MITPSGRQANAPNFLIKPVITSWSDGIQRIRLGGDPFRLANLSAWTMMANYHTMRNLIFLQVAEVSRERVGMGIVLKSRAPLYCNPNDHHRMIEVKIEFNCLSNCRNIHGRGEPDARAPTLRPAWLSARLVRTNKNHLGVVDTEMTLFLIPLILF